MGSVVFPLDIITEILSRLPVKFLLRFRCVSKPWCSLIDSKEFVKQHLNRSVLTKTNFNLILGFARSIFSISLDPIHPAGVISLDCVERLDPPQFSGGVVLNSCNGLSLVQIKKPQVSQICIWNPFTRKYIELPETPIEYPICVGSLIKKEKYAFAYVSETDDYKVVRVVEFTYFGSLWFGSEAKVFSSNSNEWKRIEDFPYGVGFERVWGAHLNGILHTVVLYESSAWSIMGFDVRSEQHAIVPNPELGICEDFSIAVDVLGGCLCLIKYLFDPVDTIADVWVMKDYGVKDSWFKLLSIATKSVAFDFNRLHHSGCFQSLSLQPLSYSKNGEEVMLNEIGERLFWYNLRTETLREITFNMDSEFYTEVCFESLVSLPGFISVDNVRGKSEGDFKKDSKEKSWGFSLKKDFKLVL